MSRLIYLLITLVASCHCIPTAEEETACNQDLLGVKEINLDAYEIKKDDGARQKRQMMHGYLWTNNTVYYEFDTSLQDDQIYLIKRAIKYISERTCIKFIHAPKAENIIVFLNDGTGCSSYVGMRGGAQGVWLDRGCLSMENSAHEIIHALGSMHTQSRYDRDEYVIVKTNDVSSWRKLSVNESFNPVPFDFASVMLYSYSDLLKPINPIWKHTIGIRLISFSDMLAINRKYQCTCPETLDCKNGGIPNPADCSKCFCPNGFGGRFCDDVPNDERTFTKKFMAGPEWVEYSLQFGFNNLYENEFMKTVLFIEAPRDKTIQVQVTGIYRFTCAGSCLWSGYEIKHMGDPRVTNPLFCCTYQEGWNATYTSKLNPTPITLYNKMRYASYLTMRYRFIDGSVDDLPKTNNTYDSFEYPI